MDKLKTPILMLFPLEQAKNFTDKYLFIGRAISKTLFTLKYDLQRAEIQIDADRYCLASIISALMYAIMFLFVGLAFGVIITRAIENLTITLMLMTSISAFTLALLFHLFYPRLAAKQLAAMVDQELLFSLRTMLIQLSSGLSLFDSMRIIARSNYGQVSEEFALTIKDINSGMSETEALERLASRTKSEVLRKTAWQITTTMKSGGSITNALNSQVNALVSQQFDSIKAYAAELNLWTLIYLIVAAALPSLGITFLVIASSIGGSGIGPQAIILILLLSISIQAGMIYLVRLKVPRVVKQE